MFGSGWRPKLPWRLPARFGACSFLPLRTVIHVSALTLGCQIRRELVWIGREREREWSRNIRGDCPAVSSARPTRRQAFQRFRDAAVFRSGRSAFEKRMPRTPRWGGSRCPPAPCTIRERNPRDAEVRTVAMALSMLLFTGCRAVSVVRFLRLGASSPPTRSEQPKSRHGGGSSKDQIKRFDSAQRFQRPAPVVSLGRFQVPQRDWLDTRAS